MSDAYGTPSSWRLRTAKNSIPYRLVEWTGSADSNNRTVTGVYLVQTSRVKEFIGEMVPTPTSAFGIPIFYNSVLPGDSTLTAVRASWKSHSPDLPADAYSNDPYAPTGTYYDVCEVTVEYTNERKVPIPSDPWTYCDFRASVAGEYIHIDAGNCKWESPGGTGAKNSYIPATRIVPEIEWTVTMPLVSKGYFENNLRIKLDLALGKVNETEFDALLWSPAECVLFVGYDLEENGDQQFGDGNADLALTITMKFLEKKVPKGTKYSEGFYGHNHFYNPEEGEWQLLYVNSNKIYQVFDMNRFFDGLDVDDLQ